MDSVLVFLGVLAAIAFVVLYVCSVFAIGLELGDKIGEHYRSSAVGFIFYMVFVVTGVIGIPLAIAAAHSVK